MYARQRFASIRHLSKRLLTLLVALGLLAGGHALHSSRLAAQAAPPAPAARNTFTPNATPHPHVRTSGAVGTPTTLRRSQPMGGVNAAALRSTNDWAADLEDDFEQGLTASWQVFDDSENGLNQQWGANDRYADSGTGAVWVAAGGEDAVDPSAAFYPPGLDTWLVTSNFFDLSNAQMADVEFSMRYDTEVLSDYVFVGASVDGENFYGEFWTGDSGGFQSFDLDLSEFIGYPQVYIAFYFHSDDVDTDNEGVWLDDVSVWTYVDNGPAQGNEAVQNGDFETGDLSQWTTLPDSATTVAEVENPVEGQHVAQFGGAPDSGEMLSQPLALPDVETQEATLAFWVNLFGEESNDDADYFCAGIYDADLNNLLVDLGCLNGVEALSANFDSANWWENKLTLDAEQWNAVRGRTVNLAFEMFTNGELNSTVYLDDVTFTVVTGGLPGDQYEPNDTGEQATPAQLATPLKELSIHSAQDVDYFKVTVEEAGLLVVNVDAANLGSPLDAVAAVSDANGATLCENDDDGQTTDPYVTCEVAAGDYFVRVTSFSGEGDRNYTYSIQFDLASSGNPPPTPTPPPPTPEPPPSTNPKRAWTAILYIDGDNNLCDSYPGLITRMENELGSRIGPNGFLYITVLIDLDKDYCNGQDGSTRLLVQPNGQYTDNVNRWNLGEVNMGDGQTLVNFATWAMQNYPADHYYLAIDDHGGGVSGISWDDTSNGDNIENNELYAALKQITNNGERKLDVFAYEACLMAMYENVYDLRQFTKYIFGFPTISFTNNASYPSYLGDQRFSANSDGRALGEIMFDVYYQAVQNAYVVSLVDSSKLDALHTAVTGLSAALRPQLNASAAKMAGARSAAQKIDANADNRLSDEDAYIDLWDLANKLAGQGLATTEVAALKQALEAAVIRVDHHPASANTPVDYANAHGLSIYWPLTPSGAYSNYVGNVIYNSTRDGQWDEFLKEFFTVLPNGRGRGGLGAEIGAIERRPDETPAAANQLYLPLIQR